MKERIRIERKRLGLTQKQLATQVGVTPGNVSHWELGISHPKGESLHNLASLFAVSANWLLYGGKGEVSGSRIKKARKEQGLSQRQLASMVGISANNISFWERGVNQPTARNLKKLSDSLNVSIDWLENGDRQGIREQSPALKAWELPSDVDLSDLNGHSITLPWINSDPFSKQFSHVDYENAFTLNKDVFSLCGLNPVHLAAIRVDDELMSPGISAGDIVLVDVDKRCIEDSPGDPFLLCYKHEKLAVRRVEKDIVDYVVWGDTRRRGYATVISSSDWPSFDVIGMVVFKLGKV